MSYKICMAFGVGLLGHQDWELYAKVIGVEIGWEVEAFINAT